MCELEVRTPRLSLSSWLAARTTHCTASYGLGISGCCTICNSAAQPHSNPRPAATEWVTIDQYLGLKGPNAGRPQATTLALHAGVPLDGGLGVCPDPTLE